MKPFDEYPGGGREPLRRRTGAACRDGYGFQFQEITGQTHCAYCGVSLVDNYYHWLLMAMDHVIPLSQARKLKIPGKWYDNCINVVLCCSGCNGFDNRYVIPDKILEECGITAQSEEDWKIEDFLQLRDQVFKYRYERIAVRRAAEENKFKDNIAKLTAKS